MIWDDTGFLLVKNKYNENSLIVEIYTKDHGKVSGIIFGGTSKKIKNYLQLGNHLHVNFNSKNENSIGYFKIEILHALSPFYFDSQQKLSCINSAIHLVKILTAESQKNEVVYNLIKKFYILLENKNWIKEYIFWELDLFKTLGYDLKFENIVDKKVFGEESQYFSKSSNEKRIIPKFLINKNEVVSDMSTLLNGLKLVGDFLEKSILKPNNLNQPTSRLQFIESLK